MDLTAELERYLRHLAIERGRSPHTLAAYRRDLTRLLDGLGAAGVREPSELTPELLTAFARGLREGPTAVAASSAARMLSSVRGFTRFLVEEGVLDRTTLVRRLTTGPAGILGLPAGTLAAGAPADLVVFDPAASSTVDPTCFRSRSRNTPFAGWTLPGRVLATLVGGRVVHDGRGTSPTLRVAS